jgi:hypothetical protein
MKVNYLIQTRLQPYNRFKERQIYFEELAKELLKDLKQDGIYRCQVVNQKNDLAFIPALRFSLERNTLKNISEYTGSVNFIETAVNVWVALKITDVKEFTLN